ncbi:uncharacterized protein LOC129767112 [Toxorhynchites rutilus septentrionalis]|uniref:uncharacterized protein LOC129767112 n=1 Tax=Toxorhynchites rutilus septentrionalis TaxID=329112 RepID=UPI0024786797|nr:uncharacterized protein LOC129767112 [Toxorhynchites rutilus septentrionalis]
MINRLVLVVVVVLVLANVVMSEKSVQTVARKTNPNVEPRQTIVRPERWWPYGWGWGWGWGIALFVLAIVKGSILLGVFVIWAFFRGFGHKTGGCAPIIIRESPPPPIFGHHHWDRAGIDNEYPRTKRSVDHTDSQLFWTDMVTDLGFSFLGVHSRDCRKRFVCEVDVRTRRDPLMKMAMNMFGVDIFRRYRAVGDLTGETFAECAKIYDKCKIAGPSVSFNVISGQVDPLQDYDDSVQYQGNDVSIYDSEDTTITEESIPTTTLLPRRKFFNKRKKGFSSNK